MAAKKGVLYFKMAVSYGEPTEYDNVGCDGMYVEGIKMINIEDEFFELKRKQGKEVIIVDKANEP